MSVSEQPEEFMSSISVAALFDVKPETVRDWIKSGKIKATQINGRWRIPKSEVIRFGNAKF